MTLDEALQVVDQVVASFTGNRAQRGLAEEAWQEVVRAARPPAPTESTPDPAEMPQAGVPTMDLLER